MTHSIETQARSTYLSLRILIAAIAFTLPPLLVIGGYIKGIPLRSSMSAYYFASPQCLDPRSPPCKIIDPNDPAKCSLKDSVTPGSLRNYFVGFLFAVGALLYVYKGFTERENWALNFAGAMAVGIALFPMDWTCAKEPTHTPHGIFAVLFFLALAFVSAFCSDASLVLIQDAKLKRRYKVIYWGLATLMIVSPGLAYVLDQITRLNSFVYIAELLGIYSFSSYWVVKIIEVSSIRSKKNRAASISDQALPA